MEKRFQTSYQDITIAVDNDSAMGMAMIFTSRVTPKDQHFDVILTIREVLSRIHKTLVPTRVKDHKDDQVSWDELTRLEQLNVECDFLAKHARRHMMNSP